MKRGPSGGTDFLLGGNILGDLEGNILRDLFCGIIWGFSLEKLEVY